MILTKLILSGEEKLDAIIEFKKGLNVISGDSDTGKTYAFQCLNYILGSASTPKDIAEANSYDTITLEFTVDDKLYTLKRKIGSPKINVITQGETIILNSKHDATNTNNISRYLLWLLLEHHDTVHLKKNNSNGKRTLSFRDIIRLCTVAETDIIAENSPFQSVQGTEKTAKESVFRYIITGVDDGTNIEPIDVDTENIRREGVVQFLLNKKERLTTQIEEIEEDESYQLYLNDDSIIAMIDKIKELRKSISDYQIIITSNSKIIKEKKQCCFEDDIKISEFKRLRQHYIDELKKNAMVSTHADFLTQLPLLSCPVCNQPFDPNIITSENKEDLFTYFTEKNIELQQRVSNLDISINNISDRLNSTLLEIDQLENENNQLIEHCDNQQNILSQMSKNIAIIRQLDAMKKTLEIYRQELVSVDIDIIRYQEKVKKDKSSPVSQDSTIYNGYCNSIETILKSWGFPGDNNLSFDNRTLDLHINGKPRSSWGKGYRAFIMSAMVVGLMRYCIENERLHPGFIVIDSPLVSLKERKRVDDEWVNDYMERKMIEDILKNDYLHQVIIFENKDLKYDFNYNYIDFNHEGDARKGFIP